MREETFLNYQGYRWLWINAAALLILSMVYYFHDPIGATSGGSVLGYTYGVVATLGILYLMYYGMRKRSYYAHQTTLRGTLAAHVWIGIALIFLVPLHSGFSFGWNVHTLAYVLMLVVIFSGIWGAVIYLCLPTLFLSQRGGGSSKDLLAQIFEVDGSILQLITGGHQTTETMMGTIALSPALIQLGQELDFRPRLGLLDCMLGRGGQSLDKRSVADIITNVPARERENALQIIGLINQKGKLVSQLQQEVRVKSLMKLWLYFHLPFSFALMVCLAIHILSVFYYW